MPRDMILGADVRAALGVQWPLIPGVDNGQQKKTTRPWKKWQGVAAGHPYDNLSAEMWSVPTGAGTGIVVLDFDGPAGDAKRRAWNLLEPHVRTGSGGHHVYVKHPGWPVRNAVGVYPGVDVRGDGGIAHVAGASQRGPYVVLRPLDDPVPYRALCPEARAALVRRKASRPDPRPAGWMPGPAYREHLIAWQVRKLSEVGAGNRNMALFSAAASLGDQRVPLEEVRPALLAAAEAAGLEEQESIWTIESWWKGRGLL